MVIRSAQLPNDVNVLRTLVTERDAELAKLREEITILRHNVEAYRRLAFGPTTERRVQTEVDHPNQGHLFYAYLLAEAERTGG